MVVGERCRGRRGQGGVTVDQPASVSLRRRHGDGPGPVRPEIARSWKRCELSGVSPGVSLDLSYDDFDRQSRLVRGAQDGLDRLAVELDHTRTCVILADAQARIAPMGSERVSTWDTCAPSERGTLVRWHHRSAPTTSAPEAAAMPLVDYRCGACGATREVFAAAPVADVVECAACGGEARRQFGLGGLLGVRPARQARDRLDRERAGRVPMDAAARQRLREHQHGHDHDHAHQHGHDHQHHAGDQGAAIQEEEQ